MQLKMLEMLLGSKCGMHFFWGGDLYSLRVVLSAALTPCEDAVTGDCYCDLCAFQS